MKSFIIVTLTALVVVFVALGSGAYNMAATEKHWVITEELITWVRESSIKTRAEELEVPAFNEEDMLEKGFKHYKSMCTGCHLAPGKEPTELAMGLYPQAPVFHKRAPITDAQDKLYLSQKYFWVTKHGIKMTAMPAWGVTHNDEDIWAITVFLHKLHGMIEEEYAQFAAKLDSHAEEGEEDDDHHHH